MHNNRLHNGWKNVRAASLSFKLKIEWQISTGCCHAKMIDRASLTASKLTNIRSVHEGRDFQESEWMAIKGQTQNEQKSQRKANMQSKHRQTTLRSKRRHEVKQVAAVDYAWIFWDFSWQPLLTLTFTFQERNMQYKMEKQNKKIVARIPRRLEMPKPLFRWIVLDITWQHVGVRSVQS